MKIENQEQLDEFFETWEDIATRAADIGQAMLRLEGYKRAVVTDDDVHVDGNHFYVEYEEHMGCGDYETHTVNIPDEYFFDENYLTEAKKELLKRKEKEKEAAEKRRKAQEERTRQRDLEQLKKLQEKYGEDK